MADDERITRYTDENVLFAMIDTASRARLSPALRSAWYVYETFGCPFFEMIGDHLLPDRLATTTTTTTTMTTNE